MGVNIRADTQTDNNLQILQINLSEKGNVFFFCEIGPYTNDNKTMDDTEVNRDISRIYTDVAENQMQEYCVFLQLLKQDSKN